MNFCINSKIDEISIYDVKDLDVEKLFLGFFLAAYEIRKYKKEKGEEIRIYTNVEKNIIEKVEKIRDAVFLARDLGNEPANILNPVTFAERVIEIFSNYKNVIVEVLNERDLEREKLNAILAIGNSSVNKPRLIVIKYLPKKDEKPIVLIGKGVCFDAGGLDIKPAEYMIDMKSDKSGAANVVAIIKLLADFNVQKNVIGILPLIENVISERATKPSDIIKIGDKTVEIVSTDAEGRLIIADAIEYSKRFNPSLYIILATLTGAQIVALGYKIAALYTNDKEIRKKIMKISREEKEFVWPMPLPKFYKKLIKGDLTDLKNLPSINSKEAGSIIGALFIREFIGNNKFVYLDIAGPAIYPKDELWIKKGASGFGVRLIANLIQSLS